jgi:hypothetical protein
MGKRRRARKKAKGEENEGKVDLLSDTGAFVPMWLGQAHAGTAGILANGEPIKFSYISHGRLETSVGIY